MKKINRALISVFDKNSVVDLAKLLVEMEVKILSTGGTAKLLRQAGIDIDDVSDYTAFPEMLDGRVKTLHPRVHGGVLAVRDNPEHMAQAAENAVEMIDLVVSNLYPFEATVARPDVDLADAIENIDIGGPAMIRAAAKNYRDVVVLTSVDQYTHFMEEMEVNKGTVSETTRFSLAKAAFAHTANYDQAISGYLASLDTKPDDFPTTLDLRYHRVQQLRYGENPHQSAAFYRTSVQPKPCAAWAEQLNGQPLSYNNLLDLEAAIEIVKDFSDPTCTLIKHNNPCGIATNTDLGQAFLQALDCDRTSAFGSIVGFNRQVDLSTADIVRNEARSGIKIEAIIAPSYTDKALKTLSRVKTRRILATGGSGIDRSVKQMRHLTGGVLIQDRDLADVSAADLQFVSQRPATEAEIQSLLFAWKACKQVKSNVILLAAGTQRVGIGAGQMSRVDAVIIAIRKAGERANRAVLASDAYFPFPDGVETAGQAGVSAVIQPGGSVNDAPVIEMANRYNMAMAFTGMRHFKH